MGRISFPLNKFSGVQILHRWSKTDTYKDSSGIFTNGENVHFCSGHCSDFKACKSLGFKKQQIYFPPTELQDASPSSQTARLFEGSQASHPFHIVSNSSNHHQSWFQHTLAFLATSLQITWQRRQPANPTTQKRCRCHVMLTKTPSTSLTVTNRPSSTMFCDLNILRRQIAGSALCDSGSSELISKHVLQDHPTSSTRCGQTFALSSGLELCGIPQRIQLHRLLKDLHLPHIQRPCSVVQFFLLMCLKMPSRFFKGKQTKIEKYE